MINEWRQNGGMVFGIIISKLLERGGGGGSTVVTVCVLFLYLFFSMFVGYYSNKRVVVGVDFACIHLPNGTSPPSMITLGTGEGWVDAAVDCIPLSTGGGGEVVEQYRDIY